MDLDPDMFKSALRRTVNKYDSNGWSDPGGKGFMVRSCTYNDDSLKVCCTSNPKPLICIVVFVKRGPSACHRRLSSFNFS